jgi:RNA polymerase sigma factor (sigma-70 family)
MINREEELNMDPMTRIRFQTEETTFDEMLTAHENYLKKIIFNILKDTAEVEDLYQETAQKIYTSRRTFRGDNFKGWIARIAVNTAINHKKKNSAGAQLIELDDENVQPGEQDPARSSFLSPREILDQKEKSAEINRIIDDLPEIYRSVIREYYISELSMQQIADQLGVSLRTIETRIYRARKMVSEKWRNHAH